MNMKVLGLDVDLREQLKELLDQYGHYVVLIKVSKLYCNVCAAQQGQQASNKCPKCMGIGKAITLHKIKAIDETATEVLILPNATIASDVGDIYANAKAFYLDYTTTPKAGDFIFEVTWAGENIGKIVGMYTVAHAEPLRMEHGRTEYYRVAGHREIDNMDFKERSMKRLPLRRS